MTQNRDWYTYPRTGAPQHREDHSVRSGKDSRLGVLIIVLYLIGLGCAVWGWLS